MMIQKGNDASIFLTMVRFDIINDKPIVIFNN